MHEMQPENRQTSAAEPLLTGLRGLAMGAAEVVPGVSGGTIAFITGIYERLLQGIQRVSPGQLQLWKQEGFAAVWGRKKGLDGGFFVALLAGMGLGILMFSNLVRYLMVHHPVLLWAFFFGLILTSCLVVSRQVQNWRRLPGFCLGAGIALGLLITRISPVHLDATLPDLFLGGALAICAFLLPGLSGSFILLLLGLYAPVLDAVRSFDLTVLAPLAAGCLVGILLFARILGQLLRRKRDAVYATLTGFMLGSLALVWPWKQTLRYQLGSQGEPIPLLQEPILPATWSSLHGTDPDFAGAVICMLLGMLLVVTLEWYGGNRFRRSSA